MRGTTVYQIKSYKLKTAIFSNLKQLLSKSFRFLVFLLSLLPFLIFYSASFFSFCFSITPWKVLKNQSWQYLRGSYEMPGIEPGMAVCKSRALFTVLLLQFLSSNRFHLVIISLCLSGQDKTQ